MNAQRSNYCRGGVGAPAQGGARWTNYAICQTCGKRIAVTKSGRLRAHGTRSVVAKTARGAA